MYRQYLTRDRLAFVASVVASARACQDSVPLVSRWYAVPASTMGEALYATRSRELNRNDTLRRAPDASRAPGLCGPPAAAAENVSGWALRRCRSRSSPEGARQPGRLTRDPARGPGDGDTWRLTDVFSACCCWAAACCCWAAACCCWAAACCCWAARRCTSVHVYKLLY